MTPDDITKKVAFEFLQRRRLEDPCFYYEFIRGMQLQKFQKAMLWLKHNERIKQCQEVIATMSGELLLSLQQNGSTESSPPPKQMANPQFSRKVRRRLATLAQSAEK